MIRKEREKRELKKRILDEAVLIIVNEGYHKLSIRKIATKIEYSPTTIYNYFDNKEAIVNQIVEEICLEVIKKVTDELKHDNNNDPKYILEKSMKVFVKAMISEPEKFKAVLLGGAKTSPDQEGTSSNESGINLLRDILSSGFELGSFQEVTEIKSEMIIVSLIGLSFFIVNNDIVDKEVINNYIESYVDLIMRGVLVNEQVI